MVDQQLHGPLLGDGPLVGRPAPPGSSQRGRPADAGVVPRNSSYLFIEQMCTDPLCDWFMIRRAPVAARHRGPGSTARRTGSGVAPIGRTVLHVRHGTPLPGLTPAQLVSQLAHRVLGPLRLHRVRAVLDYHGLEGAPAHGQEQIAARYGVTAQSVSNWVTAVGAAGAHLPLTPEMATEVSRRSRPGEDHLGRTRVARTLGLPGPNGRSLPSRLRGRGYHRTSGLRPEPPSGSSPRSARCPCPPCSTRSTGPDDSDQRRG